MTQNIRARDPELTPCISDNIFDQLDNAASPGESDNQVSHS